MDELTKNQNENLNASDETSFKCILSMRNGGGDSPLFELSDRLKALKDKKKEIETQLRDVNETILEIETALAELMVISETQNFTRSGTTFSLTTSTKASAKAGRKEELYTALKNAGYGDLVVETVNPSFLSAFVKEQISENNEALPEWLDGLVNVFEKISISMRKNKK